MKAPAKTSLDENEKKLVDQTKTLDGFTHRELTELARQLRSRRERILRMIRGRKREARQQGALSPDTGAHDKKAELIAAIDRVNAALEARAHANRAAQTAANLKAAVKLKAKSVAAKSDATHEAGHQTSNEGPIETPNKKNAPSGALMAEGRKPAAKRAGPR